MRILYLSYEFPPFHVGGLGTYAQEMAKRFVKMNNSVTVFSKNPGDASTKEMWKGVEVHRPLLADIVDLLPVIIPEDVDEWSMSSQNYFAEVLVYNILSTTKTVNDIVGEDGIGFDIIVAHDWLSAMGGIAIKRALDLPLVFHIHSTEQGRAEDESSTIKSLEKTAGKIADRIITVSDSMKEHLISLGYSPEKIKVVPNGVDPEKYDPEREEFSEEKVKDFKEKIGIGEDPMIFYVGRLTWMKGVESLIRAMPMILEEVPDAKLVILGQGGQESTITEYIEENDLQDNVITRYEFVSEEERLKYYAACDLAVFPSRYEPFGIVCTEAMSMEKPVVVGATGVNGFKEQVIASGSNRCGSHVDPESPEDIAESVIELLEEDEELRERLGKNGRSRVLNNYTLDVVAERTMEIYDMVTDSEQ